MPLYKASSGAAEKWSAARQIIIDNPHEGQGQATFVEVERVAVDGQVVVERATGRTLALTVDPENPAQIPLIDPETDEPIPEQYVPDVYIGYLLRCAYLYKARQADAAALNPPEN
jgi:hypothetical protein